MFFLIIVAGAWVTVPGCGGCTKSDAGGEAEKDTKEEDAVTATRPDFEIGDLKALPSDGEQLRNSAKPGHFVTAWVSARANRDDFRGELETATADLNRQAIRVGDPLLGETSYHLIDSRPVVLPKQQTKYLESTYYIPRKMELDHKTVFLKHRLMTERGNPVGRPTDQITRQMPSYEYHLVVLARNPNDYGYVKQLESIAPYFDQLLDDGNPMLFYRVTLPAVGPRVPLPSHPFAWTSIAYVLWDGLHSDVLTPGQQQALLDWLHWGGQLIISGPGSLEGLKGGFLEPYLPADNGNAITLGPSDMGPLNEHWSLRRKKSGDRLDLKVLETSPLIGAELACRPESQFIVGTGELVAERRVGRGRIVVTAFSLSSRDIQNWGSYDSFFNACLLRRPPREFSTGQYGSIRTDWVGYKSRRQDPLFSTATRYFSRDAAGTPASLAANDLPEQDLQGEGDWHVDGCRADAISGIGGWNDRGGASSTAHRVLTDAAGISIPDADFVLRVLAIYLVILVPVNWGIFRLVRRVEWAWGMAPLIAIVGAVVVIRLAQLDIGFVRSRTEIAILETHGGYARAHLTRYSALYTSLSSAYGFQFDDPSAVARPFLPTPSPDRLRPIAIRHDGDVRLRGFQINSNTTGFMHSEQMYELDGSLQLVGEGPGEWQVENHSSLDLVDVGVLYRTSSGEMMTTWLGGLPPQATAPLSFAAAQDGLAWCHQWADTDVGQEDSRGVVMHRTELTRLASVGLRLRPGDVRLIGWIDGDVAGVTVTPEASQTYVRVMVVAHLRFGPLPPPCPDTNLIADFLDGDPELFRARDGYDPATDPSRPVQVDGVND